MTENIIFIGRILLFCITLFLLLEYVVACNIPTNIGMIVTIIACILTFIIYYFTFGNKERQRCQCCNQFITK